MNLSARLDEARKRRATAAERDAKHPLDLRYSGLEGQHYAGREIRTGETLDEEAWRNRRAEPVDGLPRWNPRRAGRLEPDTSADVIDLTTRAGSSAIELPQWARDADLYGGPPRQVESVDSSACVNCGGEPRVDVLDLLNGVASVECRSCGFRWDAPAGDFRDVT